MRAAAILLLACAACGRPAPDAACSPDPAFDRSGLVRVRADAPAARVRRDLSLAGLQREAGTAAGTQGLTKVDHATRINLNLRHETGGGRSCAWLEGVEVDLSPRAVEILIPSEYPEGSCEYEAILAHEREHERVHRESLAEAAKRARAALESAAWLPAKGNPASSAGPDAAESALGAEVDKVVLPIIAEYKESLKASQAELDAPALYRWTSQRCSGWK